VLDGYLALQEALAADDDTRAATAADRTAAALEGVDMELLSGDAHVAWMEDLQKLRPAIEAVRSAPDIATRRDRFLPLSDALWSTLRQFRFRGDETVRLYHCPMAFDGDGGDWLQTGTTTANPYYGSQMLRCGGQTDSIPAAGAEGAM